MGEVMDVADSMRAARGDTMAKTTLKIEGMMCEGCVKSVRESLEKTDKVRSVDVNLKKGTAADLKQFLLDQYGILIRDASNFRGLDETYLRLSTQKADENQALIEGIKHWLGQQR